MKILRCPNKDCRLLKNTVPETIIRLLKGGAGVAMTTGLRERGISFTLPHAGGYTPAIRAARRGSVAMVHWKNAGVLRPRRVVDV